MRSILRQLSCSKPDLPVRRPVVRVYEEKKEEAMGEPPSLSIEECENLILALLENDPATIIIDALDECDPSERYKLLDALRSILSKSASLVKIFVSCRDDGDIVCRLIESPNIYVHASNNHGDIKRFIEFEVDKAIKGKRILRGLVPEDVRAEITQTLIKNAQGMFRWASLQIQNLCDPQRIKHPGEVRQELKRLPKSLKQSYDVVYERIKNSGDISKAVAESTIKWLMCAQRPLDNLELLAAVAVNPSWNISRTLDRDILLDMCCNLVVLDTQLNVFRFAHLSVQEYFAERHDYYEIETHIFAVERCLRVFSSEVAVQEYDGLTLYAFFYWPVHYQKIENHDLPDQFKTRFRQLCALTCQSAFLKTWMNAAKSVQHSIDWKYRYELRQILSTPPTTLFLACMYDLPSIIEHLTTTQGINWDILNFAGDPALIVATKNRSSKVVASLIAAGADVNALGADGPTSLGIAAREGYIDIIEILLSARVDVNATRTLGPTALQFAAIYGACPNRGKAFECRRRC